MDKGYRVWLTSGDRTEMGQRQKNKRPLSSEAGLCGEYGQMQEDKGPREFCN